ncbi:C3a anaphylatoxin chemotactic receptor-like [Astyanax mexicanus]|uniref:C3a anaphylatoxin chemotactic receptor-like n=1 Tax=Astyanax mexicanus TaxID=7994 RepID=A0A8T2KWM6_ASTMX|nr:C3a anaphylatoxin chemotactic receptor-like [Astyanax mexicanus]
MRSVNLKKVCVQTLNWYCIYKQKYTFSICDVFAGSQSIMTSTPVRETQYPVSENYTTPNMAPADGNNILFVLFAVSNFIIFILGVVGNAVVIWIAGFKLKRSVNTTWYLSLAISDLMLCFFLPFGVMDMVINEWAFGFFMCKFWSFFMSLNMFSSVFLLVIISVDRCVVVVFPVWAQNKRTIRKASVVVVVMWMTAGLLSTPAAVFHDVLSDDHNHSKFCFYSYMIDQNHFAEVAGEFIFGFVVPILIVVICYVLIIQKLKTNQSARFKKPFKIMTMLITVFLIWWLPYHTVALMDLNYEKYESFLPTGYVFVIILASANSCLNPYLYAFMGQDFKRQCFALLSKIENAIDV